MTENVGIGREDAAQALRDVEAAAGRSATAFRYGRAAPFLLLWGALWLTGALAAALSAPQGRLLMLALVAAGVIGSVGLGVRMDRRFGPGSPLKSLVIFAAIVLLVQGLAVVLPAGSLANLEAVMCLIVGATYMVAGLFVGWRLSAVGAALMAGVILAALYGGASALDLVGAAGGLVLMLGGFWLRRA